MQIVTGNEIPSSLAAMKTFLQPLVDNGFCDAIEYNNDANPTKLLLYKDDAVVVQLLFAATRKWGCAIPGAGGNMHGIEANAEIQYIYLCKKGVLFVRPDNVRFALSETNEGKIAMVVVSTSSYSGYTRSFFTTSLTDNTANSLYTNGYPAIVYSLRTSVGGVADRTILTRLPVVGQPGTSDYLSTVLIRNTVQFAEDGVQIIGGKQYGCVADFAILDE